MNNKISRFLTPKQQAFCDEYLVDRNASRAALKAGYSAWTALNGRLMTMPKIRLYLQEQTEKLSKQATIDTDMVLRELGKVAFANMANYFGADGKLKPMNELTLDESAALHSVTISPDGTIKIRLCNKMTALDRIARHLNFYKPEAAKPEKEYVYLDKDDMTEDDWFDDGELLEELEEELKAESSKQKAFEEPEVGGLRQEAFEERPEAGSEKQKAFVERKAESEKLKAGFEQELFTGALQVDPLAGVPFLERGVGNDLPLSGRRITDEVMRARKAHARLWR